MFKVLNKHHAKDYVPEYPDWLSNYGLGTVDELQPLKFWERMVEQLKPTGCLHLIPPTLIVAYAISRSRFYEFEVQISKLMPETVANYEKANEVLELSKISLTYSKQAREDEDRIWDIVLHFGGACPWARSK